MGVLLFCVSEVFSPGSLVLYPCGTHRIPKAIKFINGFNNMRKCYHRGQLAWWVKPAESHVADGAVWAPDTMA